MIRLSHALAIGLVPFALAADGAPAFAQSGPPHDMAMPAFPQTIADWAKGAQLFEGLGTFHRPVATSSPEAQLYFDQGMRFIWAFNHDEAARSFAKAAELDPDCAACYWGLALVLGPNYNMPMMAEPRARVAWDALSKARLHAAGATPADRALIEALGKRYQGPQPLDPSNEAPLMTAYAAAMKEAAASFPADLDIQTLYAEAMMNLRPWKLWNADGTPAEGTPEILATLESVIARDPMHPGANHYYIHAAEASPRPERALVSAERLRGMMPAAGHLEHMPAHIMQRVGRYEDSAEANRKGAAADLAYYGRTAPPDYYPMYTAHNYQFLAFSAAMEGRRTETLAAIAKVEQVVPQSMLATMPPGIDWSLGYAYEAKLRFGLWADMLGEPAPDSRYPGLTASYLAGRAVALAATGRVAEAKTEAAKLDALIAATPADAPAGFNSARDMFAIAALKARARIAAAEHQPQQAVALLTEAVAKEDAIAYNEPSDAFFPARHLLGAALLAAGKPREAEAVYREDLKRNPTNGWALYGLAKALDAQGRGGEAVAVRGQFTTAWQHADTKIAASAF